MDYLTIAYKGASSNDVYTAYYDGSKWYGNNKISNQPGGIRPETNSSPGATVFNNWLYLLYRGASSNSLYLSWHDGKRWAGKVKISEMNGNIDPKSSSSPNIVVYKGGLYTVYRGADSEALYMAWFDGTTWHGNKKISDIGGEGISPESSDNPGMVVFGSPSQLYIIYKRAGSDALYTAVFDDQGWRGDTKIKDQAGNINPESKCSPGAVVFKDKLYIVYKSARSNALRSAWYDGVQWDGDTEIKDQGGSVNPQSDRCPHAEVYNKKLYIVYKGAQTNALYSAWYDGGTWAGNTQVKDQGGNIAPESKYNPGMSVSAIKPVANSDWMRQLPDAVLISEINVPGSHDAAAINTWMHTPYACHNYSITDQLEYGIRLLDVRLQVSQQESTFKFMTCHGDLGSSVSMNTYQSFPSLLDECKAYLGNHTGEVVLLSLKVEDWSDTSDQAAAQSALGDLLRMYPTTALKSIPKLGDVRGKIFLYNRINNSLNLGVPISWKDNTGGSDAPSSSNRSYRVYVQDRYKKLVTSGTQRAKFDLVKNAFLQKKAGEVVWNFASATWYGLGGVYIMGYLLSYFGADPAANRLSTFGWTLFDYPFNYYTTDPYDAMNIVQLIISSNSNPRYAAYEKTFKVVSGGHSDL